MFVELNPPSNPFCHRRSSTSPVVGSACFTSKLTVALSSFMQESRVSRNIANPGLLKMSISDLSATCRARPEYLIETVQGIGLSIAASYFCNEFHQPNLQSILRHGNEIGKQRVFGLGFFNDLLTPVGSPLHPIGNCPISLFLHLFGNSILPNLLKFLIALGRRLPTGRLFFGMQFCYQLVDML